jgi:hypothetical protein
MESQIYINTGERGKIFAVAEMSGCFYFIRDGRSRQTSSEQIGFSLFPPVFSVRSGYETRSREILAISVKDVAHTLPTSTTTIES